jgi:hypothetical protein
LITRTLAGFCRPLRLGTQECKMLITKPHDAGLDVRFFDLTRRVRSKSAAVRSLKIAELEHRDRRVGVTFEMPGL